MPLLKLREEDLQKIDDKRNQTLKKTTIVCKYLCSLGAKAIYIFGSVLTDEFRGYSDVDIAVEGLPYEHIYRVEAKIEEILGGMDFDLIYLEYAPESMVARIKQRGTKYACNFS